MTGNGTKRNGITWAIHPNGTADLTARLKAAIARHYELYQALPVAVTVHTTEADAAREVIAALELSVPVMSTGGCLTTEAWTGCKNGKA